jgi:hypothetical protein
VIETLTTPNWYFDRKGEISPGQDPWYVSSVLYTERRDDNSNSGVDDSLRVWNKVDPNNLTSLARYNSGPDAVIPPLSEKQTYALKMLEQTASELALHMILEPGDIQLLANGHVLHARTAYKDWPPGSVDESGRERVRRHLMRLWLAVPESEGGLRTPFFDSDWNKRGGIKVGDVPPVCPLDAE